MAGRTTPTTTKPKLCIITHPRLGVMMSSPEARGNEIGGWSTGQPKRCATTFSYDRAVEICRALPATLAHQVEVRSNQPNYRIVWRFNRAGAPWPSA